jgi:anaerobic selenocysteine-containing dehydrogenase
MVATNAAFARLYDLLTSMPGVARCWPARWTQVPSARAAHLHDAQKRGIKDGDVVRIYNSRGACLAGAVVIDTMLPGVEKLSRRAWYDPAGAEDGAVCVHGNANVLRHDRGTLKLSQGPSSGTNMVEIECWKEPLPPVRAFEPPEVVPGITNSPWTGLQLYGHHNPGSVEYF